MKVVQVILAVVAFILFGSNLFTNSYLGKGGERFGLNFSSISEVSGEYETDITPAGWAFSIWGIIYLWQILLQIYLLLTIFCNGTTSSSLRILDMPFPYLSFFYVCYILNYVSVNFWVVVWCLKYVVYATPFLAVTATALWYALRIAVTGTPFGRQGHPLRDQSSVGKGLMIFFVHNGIGIYSTWTTIATLINIVVTMVYDSGISMVTSCVTALSILSVLTILWFSLDVFLLKESTRYLLTPYCVLVFALTANLAKNWNDGSTTGIFILVLLIVSSLLLLTKLILIAVAGYKKMPSTARAKGNSEKQVLVY